MQNINTMHYLFAAYAAIWVILAVYLFSIQSREKRLRDELQNLRQLLESRQKGSKG
jgi:CcmD family protein